VSWFTRLLPKSTPPVVIVSGLPRSGTSLMMQMLGAGGLSLLTDAHRPPDESNPRGYFEYSPVKRMHIGETAWLSQAGGRGVKIVSALLRALPDGVAAQVLFMQRDLSEVVRSQQAMLERLGKPVQASDADSLAEEYASHLSAVRAWLAVRPSTTFLDVPYSGLVCEPSEHVPRIAAFLGGALDTAAMVGVVDLTLYRERG
jgi:hypothetical protein